MSETNETKKSKENWNDDTRATKSIQMQSKSLYACTSQIVSDTFDQNVLSANYSKPYNFVFESIISFKTYFEFHKI